MENWKRKPSGRAIDRLTLHRSGEVVWLSFPILDRFDFLLNGFSTRLGGVSEGDTGTMNLSFSREPDRGKVRENHERLAEAMGYRTENLVFSAQTHTDHIVEAGASDRGNGYLRENCFQDVDGMMTDEPELVLMTFFADCVPLLIADPRRRAIAALGQIRYSIWLTSPLNAASAVVSPRTITSATATARPALTLALGFPSARRCASFRLIFSSK